MALPFDSLLSAGGGLGSLTGLLGGLSGGAGSPLSLLTGLTGGGEEGSSSPLSILSSLTGGLGGGSPLDLLSGLTGGLGGGTATAALPGVDALGGLAGGGLPGLDALGGLSGGGLPGLDALGGLSGGGLPGLDLLSGGLGGLGGVGGGAGTSGTGDIGGSSSSPIGGLLATFADATHGIPILGENVNGIVGQGVEGGSLSNFLVTPLYGTPLFGPAQSLLGGNSVGEEIILYDVATRPVALTEGLPIVNDVTRSVVGGDLPSITAFIGAYSGGLLSEDYLQFLVTEQGTLGALTNAVEGAAVDLPLIGDFTDGKQLNATLDLLTGATDQILYVDDIVAGIGGGDQLSNDLPFHQVLAATGLGGASAGLLAPVGDVFFPAIEPITNLVQEVPIAGPINLGAVGKFL
ncbi:MAG: hypothetical protein V4738_12115 [Pseudomonadota bacterium]